MSKCTKEIIKLCEEIGNWYGDFFMNEKGQYCIDNGIDLFEYDTPTELLKDWLETLELSYKEDAKTYPPIPEERWIWKKEIEFIKSL